MIWRTVRTESEMEELVEEVGFLPLFAGGVPGFSVEEHTTGSAWWTGDPETDPWEWRVTAARRENLAYGKFFDGRAGFLSKKWLPVFANYRRDGYDFDARWEDELASWKQKKIMDLFLEGGEDAELFSFEVKQRAGFGKSGEKNFEGTLTSLEMQTYLVCRDFRQRKSRKGEPYGWEIAVLSTPEHIFGRDLVTSEYDTDPKESLRQIEERVRECCEGAVERQILRLVGYAEDRKASKAVLSYPLNLFAAIDKNKDPQSWTKDQIAGLYVALGQLRPKHQKVLFEKYHDGKKNEEIGREMNRAAGTVSSYQRTALYRLQDPLIAAWYRDGYAQNLKACAWGEHWQFPLPEDSEEILPGDLCLRIGLKVRQFESLQAEGISTVSDLESATEKNTKWYRQIPGIGEKTAQDIERKLAFFGFGRKREG